MDLLSSIRKSGSRGGVNFSWDEVKSSQHRENYLGHSLMAPVGRWQKSRDLSWYAKGDEQEGESGETLEEKRIRERKEEIKRIKEAEEDALSRALGLPVADRNVTGVNAISVGEVSRVIKEAEISNDEVDRLGTARGFGDYVGNTGAEVMAEPTGDVTKGGLLKEERQIKGSERIHDQSESASREKAHRRHRHRSRSPERRRHRSRSGERHRHRLRHREEREGREDRDDRRPRSRGADRKAPRFRSRSPERRNKKEDRRQDGGSIRRQHKYRSRRSRSPIPRDSGHRGSRY